MIQLKSQSNKTLNLILSNTNKALREVLKDIAPKDLATLKQSKDLGSVLDSLLKNSETNKTQNQELIQLLKNNPTLKQLGNVTTTLKDLQTTLQKLLPQQTKNEVAKQESLESKQMQKETISTPIQTQEVKKSLLQNLEKIQKVLTETFENIKTITDKTVKNKIENSGVFFESKLKNFTTPQKDLKTLIQEFSTLLQNSKLPSAKSIVSETNGLLTSKLFKTELQDPKQLTALTQKIETLLAKSSKHMESNFDKVQHPKDILFSKEFKELHTKISLLNKPEKLLESTKLKELISDDFKHIVKETTKELQNTNIPQKDTLIKHLDKLNLQIDYYQLLSHLSNASCLYLPYSFDALEDGSITIKSAKNGKFFCDIELTLKEYGNLKLRLGMFEKNQLNINIECESQELENILKENLQELRENLYNAGIQPQSIRFIQSDIQQHYQQDKEIELGFEVKA